MCKGAMMKCHNTSSMTSSPVLSHVITNPPRAHDILVRWWLQPLAFFRLSPSCLSRPSGFNDLDPNWHPCYLLNMFWFQQAPTSSQ
jgi:hypothetical protein